MLVRLQYYFSGWKDKIPKTALLSGEAYASLMCYYEHRTLDLTDAIELTASDWKTNTA